MQNLPRAKNTLSPEQDDDKEGEKKEEEEEGGYQNGRERRDPNLHKKKNEGRMKYTCAEVCFFGFDTAEILTQRGTARTRPTLRIQRKS